MELLFFGIRTDTFVLNKKKKGTRVNDPSAGSPTEQ